MMCTEIPNLVGGRGARAGSINTELVMRQCPDSQQVNDATSESLSACLNTYDSQCVMHVRDEMPPPFKKLNFFRLLPLLLQVANPNQITIAVKRGTTVELKKWVPRLGLLQRDYCASRQD
jgi:hypothetical protein